MKTTRRFTDEELSRLRRQADALWGGIVDREWGDTSVVIESLVLHVEDLKVQLQAARKWASWWKLLARQRG